MWWVTPLTSVGAAGAAAFITYWYNHRGERHIHSGKIETSEAAELWEESRSIRQELRNALEAQTRKYDQLTVDHNRCLAKTEALSLHLQSVYDQLKKVRRRFPDLDIEVPEQDEPETPGTAQGDSPI